MGGTETQLLTFELEEEEYCVDIDYVAEIVDGQEITSLPNSDSHVEGVTDLRGETTTIVNPCDILDIDSDELLTDGGETQNRIVVLDSESLGSDGATGWVVSAVNEVRTVDKEAVDADNVGEADLLRGLIKDDDEFTIWLNPTEFTA